MVRGLQVSLERFSQGMTSKGGLFGLISSKCLAYMDVLWGVAINAPIDKDLAKMHLLAEGGRHFDPSTGRVNV